MLTMFGSIRRAFYNDTQVIPLEIILSKRVSEEDWAKIRRAVRQRLNSVPIQVELDDNRVVTLQF